jgi:1-deoxy-D-xylulose-5-phosphate reductoisomerase
MDAMRKGGSAPTILNAANEIAVDAFLNRRIGFLDIARVVETTLSESPNANTPADTLDGVLAVDARARELAAGICRRVVN